MRKIGLFFLLIFFTACSQNVGVGLGITGISSSGKNMTATQIVADSDTGIHGSVSMGTDIRL